MQAYQQKKWKNSSFAKKKCFIGSVTVGVNPTNVFHPCIFDVKLECLQDKDQCIYDEIAKLKSKNIKKLSK